MASYRFRPGNLGTWTFTAAYNYNSTRIVQRLNTLGPLATIPGIVLFGRVEGIRFTDGQPRDKIVLSRGRRVRQFRADRKDDALWLGDFARRHRADRRCASLNSARTDDILLGPKWITDLELPYRPIEHLELAVGANNLFDVYPDRSPFGARTGGVGGVYPINQYYLPYTGFSPFGFNGRFLYARASIRF